MDEDISKQLLEIFSSELEEKLQIITDALLKLEATAADNSDAETISAIFRAAHNIKGSAHSIGIIHVSEIAHHIESLFTDIKKGTITIQPEIITRCLTAVDGMRVAMQCFLDNQPLPPNVCQLTASIDTPESVTPTIKDSSSEKNNALITEKKPTDLNAYETVRVSLHGLDRISAMMEELQINKMAIDDHYAELSHLENKIKKFDVLWQKIMNNTAKTSNEFFQREQNLAIDYWTEISDTVGQMHQYMHMRIHNLTILCDSMQEEIRMLRLVPAATLLSHFPRTVRDLARELNKKVELKIIGDTVKLDKMILESLKDPLIHLLRNAIDHGLESAEVRKAHGKSEIGHIVITVKEEGSHILLTISDDGGGIDIKKVADTAQSKQIITASMLKTLKEEDILQFIFSPGFSTKEHITDISGRGVGLDVVKSNLTDLKGEVTVTTELSKGTTFCLRVPLTLVSDRGLIVMSAGQQFALLTDAVERVLWLKVNDILEVEATQMILVDDHAVPLRDLASILALQELKPLHQDEFPVVIIQKNQQRLALLVENIIGEREMVIKPLQPPLAHINGISGATLSGGGQIILVLNIRDLLDMALHTKKDLRINVQKTTQKSSDQTHILVVDDSITTRTLEKNVLEASGYKVTVSVNGKEAWDLLQKQKFSLIITDVDMPIMDGFLLTERVKGADSLRHMPVIIVTSLDSPVEKKRGIDVGADAYIVKGEFESGKLLEVVTQLT